MAVYVVHACVIWLTWVLTYFIAFCIRYTYNRCHSKGFEEKRINLDS